MKTTVKSIIGACALSLFLISGSFAQDAGSTMDAQTEDTYTEDDTYTQDGMEKPQSEGQLTQEDNKVPVEKEEIPAEVSDAIQDSEYADWSIAEAYELTEDEEVLYEIHFENPQGQMEKESFSKNGKVIAR